MDIQTTVLAGDWSDEDAAVASRAARQTLGTANLRRAAELSLALADDATVRVLNRDYRGQDEATNVLSFEAGSEGLPGGHVMLGDVVLAYETCAREAEEAGKTFADHLSHLTVHGVLHLLGYDHETDGDAAAMELLEAKILAEIGIDNPYVDEPEAADGCPE